jgi:uncharacterized cofD-like protein
MKKIVTMGGGTGSFTVLRGLKKYPLELKAIVAMTDDGGSSGELRDEMGVLPPGDLRQCLVALSESPEVMREIFNYRFSKGKISGHNLGNLLISSLEEMKGGLDEALPYINNLLALKGEVIPVTFDKVKLVAELGNNKILTGEHNITESTLLIEQKLKKLYTEPKARANSRAIKAIKEADAIIIGPGNLYCSILPIFLVSGTKQALKKKKAKVFYNVNLMTQHGHTDNFNIFDYVDKLEQYLGKDIIDYVIFNNKKPFNLILKKYSEEGNIIDFPKEKRFKKDNKIFIGKNLISSNLYNQKTGDSIKRTLIRHDSDKLAKVIIKLLNA